MTQTAKTPLGGVDFERPRAGSWLDKSARRIEKILVEKYGLKGFDPDSAYLSFAEELRNRRDAVADQIGVSAAAAQRYFDEETFEVMARSVARSLSGEKPGTDPFADHDKIPVDTEDLVHAIWSLQIAAAASRHRNDDYAWSLARVATSLSMIHVHSIDTVGVTAQIQAPRAGITYAARVLDGASQQILAWGDGIEGLTAEQLAEGLAHDAEQLGGQT